LLHHGLNGLVGSAHLIVGSGVRRRTPDEVSNDAKASGD
jgi:hypothetical protein